MNESHHYPGSTRCIKFISALTLLFFSISNVVFANPTTVYKIKVSEDYGTVKNRYRGVSDKTVIFIEDAHASSEAQNNISSIIKDLVAQDVTTLIGLEGAAGTIPIETYRSFPVKEARNRVAHDYLNAGIFTGAEVAGITAEKECTLFGVEDNELFKKNFSTFYHVTKQHNELLGSLDQIEQLLEQLKQNVFNKELLRFDAAAVEFEKSERAVESFFPLLYEYIQKTAINELDYVNLVRLNEALTVGGAVDIEQMSVEKKFLLNEIEQHVGIKDLSSSNENEIFQYINNQAKLLHISLAEYPAFSGYCKYKRMYSQVDFSALLSEIRQLSHDIRLSVARSAKERELLDVCARLHLLKRVVMLEATREEISSFTADKDNMKMSYFVDFIVKNIPIINQQLITQLTSKSLNNAAEDVLSAAGAFYDDALKRDRALVENLLSEMNSKKADTAVLVSGGFHSQGIMKLLEDKKINFLTVTPAITTSVQDLPYIDKMTGRLFPLSPELTSYITILSSHAARNNIDFGIQFDENAIAKALELIVLKQADLATVKQELSQLGVLRKDLADEEFQLIIDRITTVFDALVSELTKQYDGKTLSFSSIQYLISQIHTIDDAALKRALLVFQENFLDQLHQFFEAPVMPGRPSNRHKRIEKTLNDLKPVIETSVVAAERIDQTAMRIDLKGEAVLLPEGTYLVPGALANPKTDDTKVKLVRSIIHEETEAMLQVMQHVNPARHAELIQIAHDFIENEFKQYFPNEDVSIIDAQLRPHHAIARIVELLFVQEHDLAALSEQEYEFLQNVENLITGDAFRDVFGPLFTDRVARQQFLAEFLSEVGVLTPVANAKDEADDARFPGYLGVKSAVYFSLEIALPGTVFAGGLGKLAADTVRAMADLPGADATFITLMYKRGRKPVKKAEPDGRIYYERVEYENDYADIKADSEMAGTITVNIAGQDITVRVWKQVIEGEKGGRSTVLYLDADESDISGLLYTDSKWERFTQELLLGKGGVAALKLINLQPEIIHMNEAASAYAAPAAMEDPDQFFKDTHYVFATHTPVQAAKEPREPDWWWATGFGDKYFNIFHHWNEQQHRMVIDQLYGGAELADIVYSVARQHAYVTRGETEMPAVLPDQAYKTTHVTNGSYVPYWRVDALKRLREQRQSDRLSNTESGQMLLERKQRAKQRLLSVIEQLTDNDVVDREDGAYEKLVRHIRWSDGQNNGTLYNDLFSCVEDELFKTILVTFLQRHIYKTDDKRYFQDVIAGMKENSVITPEQADLLLIRVEEPGGADADFVREYNNDFNANFSAEQLQELYQNMMRYLRDVDPAGYANILDGVSDLVEQRMLPMFLENRGVSIPDYLSRDEILNRIIEYAAVDIPFTGEQRAVIDYKLAHPESNVEDIAAIAHTVNDESQSFVPSNVDVLLNGRQRPRQVQAIDGGSANAQTWSMDKPTLVFSRRVVPYKRLAMVLMTDEVHYLCGQLGMQIVVAGNVYDKEYGIPMLNQIEYLRNTFGYNIVYVPDYDVDPEVNKMIFAGSDFGLHIPQPWREASGTSFQMMADNGVIVGCSFDGAPIEHIQNGVNGFIMHQEPIDPHYTNSQGTPEIRADFRRMIDSMYELWQNKTEFGEVAWNAFTSSEGDMSAVRMGHDYYEQLYKPLIDAGRQAAEFDDQKKLHEAIKTFVRNLNIEDVQRLLRNPENVKEFYFNFSDDEGEAAQNGGLEGFLKTKSALEESLGVEALRHHVVLGHYFNYLSAVLRKVEGTEVFRSYITRLARSVTDDPQTLQPTAETVEQANEKLNEFLRMFVAELTMTQYLKIEHDLKGDELYAIGISFLEPVVNNGEAEALGVSEIEARALVEEMQELVTQYQLLTGRIKAGTYDVKTIADEIVHLAELTAEFLGQVTAMVENSTSQDNRLETIRGVIESANRKLGELLRGDITLNKEYENIVELVESMVNMYRQRFEAEGRSLTVTFNVTDGAMREFRYLVDPSRIRRVVQNLVVNAAEAIEGEGTITVTLNDNERGLELIVNDTGRGMSQDEVDVIFDKYFSTKEDDGRIHGLGLANVVDVVVAHGGTIDVQSTEGQGSTFVVSIPAERISGYFADNIGAYDVINSRFNNGIVPKTGLSLPAQREGQDMYDAVVVCQSNLFRSKFIGHWLAKDLADEPNVRVSSRGMRGMDPEHVLEGQKLVAEGTPGRWSVRDTLFEPPQVVSAEEVARASVIFVMNQRMKQTLIEAYGNEVPDLEERIRVMSDLVPSDSVWHNALMNGVPDLQESFTVEGHETTMTPRQLRTFYKQIRAGVRSAFYSVNHPRLSLDVVDRKTQESGQITLSTSRQSLSKEEGARVVAELKSLHAEMVREQRGTGRERSYVAHIITHLEEMVKNGNVYRLQPNIWNIHGHAHSIPQTGEERIFIGLDDAGVAFHEAGLNYFFDVLTDSTIASDIRFNVLADLMSATTLHTSDISVLRDRITPLFERNITIDNLNNALQELGYYTVQEYIHRYLRGPGKEERKNKKNGYTKRMLTEGGLQDVFMGTTAEGELLNDLLTEQIHFSNLTVRANESLAKEQEEISETQGSFQDRVQALIDANRQGKDDAVVVYVTSSMMLAVPGLQGLMEIFQHDALGYEKDGVWVGSNVHFVFGDSAAAKTAIDKYVGTDSKRLVVVATQSDTYDGLAIDEGTNVFAANFTDVRQGSVEVALLNSVLLNLIETAKGIATISSFLISEAGTSNIWRLDHSKITDAIVPETLILRIEEVIAQHALEIAA